MAFSPGWCYQPALKGPDLYISNGFIFYLSIYTSIIAAATAIFDLASVAPAPPGRTSSSSLPRRRRLLPPPGRAIRPAASRLCPHPSPLRRPLPARPAASSSSPAVSAVVRRPRAIEVLSSAPRVAGQHALPARAIRLDPQPARASLLSAGQY